MSWLSKTLRKMFNGTPSEPDSLLWDRVGGQAGSLDYLDEYGYTKNGRMPDGRIAPQVQYDSNRKVLRRNTRLTGDALGVLDQGLQNLQTYRPGGAAALMSPYYQSMANTILSDKADFADNLYWERRDRAREAAKEARRAGYMGLAGSLIGAAGSVVGGALAGGAGGLSTGSAAILAGGNVAASLARPGGAGGEGYQQNQGDSPYSQTPSGKQAQAGGWIPAPGAQGQQPQPGGPTPESQGAPTSPGQVQGSGGNNGYGNWGGGQGGQTEGPPGGPTSPGPLGGGGGPGGPGPQGGPEGAPGGPGAGVGGPAGGGGIPTPSGPDLGAMGYTNEGQAETFASEMGLSSGQVVGLIRLVEGADGDEFWDNMHGRLESLMAG